MPRTALALRLALVSAGASLIAACGGSGKIGPGGLTAGDRKAAESALFRLRSTAIPTALIQATAVAAAAPEVCRIRLESTNPRRFRLFLFWTPQRIADPILGAGEATYTWFDASLGGDVVEDTFHLGHASARKPKAGVLDSHAGNVFSKPGGHCQLLTNGYLRLLT